ncbi:hypothetical protein Dsin_028635 [Dipteronia sinensis]|uniref:Uncharacterized protein n=1 Tax=Dipteronia sinensis TaxID=43782 RepID=A0AAD9ZRH7_9ROSI|nr:hypothetical protein Dsin_028635 [Dipteronia sinensis]
MRKRENNKQGEEVRMLKKKPRGDMETEDQEMDIRKIMKDIEFLGSSHMTWKERKELENKRVVSLGGKPQKKQRLPLSVARVPMKRQKEREQKMQQEIADPKKPTDKRRPEDRVLKSTEGRFRNGVLDVKHMLHPTSSRDTGADTHMGGKGKKKGRGKKNQGNKKKGKRH